MRLPAPDWRFERLDTALNSAPLITEQRPEGRSFFIDALKASGCVLIVLHHMAFYGPMSDVVSADWPRLMTWLAEHGRLAVQVFLVCAGFLTAGSLAKWASLDLTDVMKLAWRRYLRLAIPLMAALSFTVLVTEWIRPDFEHASLSAPPDWGQALAHVVLLQHIMGLDALSAGVWYVAIDFQLYVMVLLSLVLVKAFHFNPSVLNSSSAWRWGFWLLLTCCSLWWWNLQTHLDDHGIYFFGFYGLGLLAWEARRRHQEQTGRVVWSLWSASLLLLILGGVAWWLSPRLRVVTACGVACLLIWMPAGWFSCGPRRSPWLQQAVVWLSTVSYCVFLLHFGVSLAVNALFTALWPNDLWMNALGMMSALVLSIAGGGLLYRWVESLPPSLWRWWLWAGVFKASIALAMVLNAPVV